MIRLGLCDDRLEPADVLETILRASTEHAIVVLDRDWRVITWSTGATRLYGYSPEEVVGRDFTGLAPAGTYDPELPRAIARGLREDGIWDGPLSAVRPDGSTVSARATFTPRVSIDGTLQGYLLIAKDRAAELDELSDKMRTLLGAIVQSREADRRRVAAEIHDDTIQIMTAVGMKLQTVNHRTDDPEVAAVCRVVGDEVASAIGRLREMIHELNPPDSTPVSLRHMLEVAIEEAASLGGFTGRIRGRPVGEPSDTQVAVIRRIVRESLSNAARHAQASTVTVTLQDFADGLLVQVRDNGIGFSVLDAADLPGHLGMRGMREAATTAGGWLQIQSVAGQGSMVEFWVPLAGQA